MTSAQLSDSGFPEDFAWGTATAAYQIEGASTEDGKGEPNRDTAKAFAEFAHLAATRLGDRVGQWITHNEPHVVVYHGYLFGSKAPGLKDPTLIAPVAHHLLLSHGLATEALRAAGARE